MLRNVILVALICLTLSSVADTEEVDNYTWRYRINGDTAEISSGSYAAISPVPMGAVTVPSTLGGKPVTSIGYMALNGCSGLTSVTIPDSVTSIGNSAFSGCSGLTNVTIGSGVMSIGAGAFASCRKLTNVMIPNSVTSIGGDAFSYCSGLTSVTIGNGVVSFGSSAFEFCTNLTSVTIGNGVTSIGVCAFYWCSGLTSVTIPNSVTNIGHNAFGRCTELINIIFLGNAPTADMFDNVHSDCTSFVRRASTGWGVVIPGIWKGIRIEYLDYFVTFDANGGVGGRSGLQDYGSAIVVPTVTRTGYTFAGWSPGVAATVPANDVTYVAQWTPNKYTVTFDANGGVGGTSGLLDYDSTLIAPTVSRTGYTLKGWSPSLPATVPLGGGSYTAQWEINRYVVTFDANGGVGGESREFEHGSNLTAPVVTRKDYDFVGWFTAVEGGSEVTAGSAVTGEMTLYAHWVLKPNVWLYEVVDGKATVTGYSTPEGDIAIPSEIDGYAVTAIATNAFYGCTGLSGVTIPESVTEIGEEAFRNCSGMESIVFEGDAPSVGAGAFDGVNSNCVGIISRSASGWGEPISRTWNGLLITYPSYNVVFNANGGECAETGRTVDHGATIGDLPVPTRTGYAFDGWYSAPSGGVMIRADDVVVSDVQACAHWTPNKYTVTFNANGGDGGTSAELDYESSLVPPTVTRTGYTFRDWSPAVPATVPLGGGTYTAQWEINKYIVTFDANGGTGGTNQVFVYGSGLVMPEVARKDHNLVGWFTATEGGAEVLPGSVITGEMTLYAHWALKPNVCLYEVVDGKVTITGFSTPEGNIAIPSELDGYPVTAIGANAFRDCTNLTSVTLPVGVGSIGSYAFAGCSNLVDVTLPVSVTNIESSAFRECIGLTNITIPEGLESIKRYVFSSCSALTRVVIPDGVTSIGNGAFSGCSGLTSVTIGSGVTDIGSSVFYNCTSLTNVTIPNGVTSIGKSAFQQCTNLTVLTMPDSVKAVAEQAFYGCNGLTNVAMGSGVTTIADKLFYNCSGLASMTIPLGVTDIGSYAFYGCSNIRDVTIPVSVTSIGSNTFYNCSALTNLTIPSGVTSIGGSAFRRCRGLTEVTIPGSVKSIKGSLFRDCTGLKNVTIGSGVVSIGNSSFDGCSALTNVTIPSSATSIGTSSFQECTSLIKVMIPDSMKTVGKQAFYGCKGLTSMTIGNGVTSIGDNAFNGCSGLRDLTVPQYVCTNRLSTLFPSAYRSITNVVIRAGVTSVGGYAFDGCSGLMRVTIPDSVTSIGACAFNNCNASLYDTSSIPGVKLVDGWVVGVTGTLSGDFRLAGVRGICDSAFSGCTGLASVTIGNSVTNIDASVFSGCSGLTNVFLSVNYSGSTDVFPSGAEIFRYKPNQTVTLDANGGTVPMNSVMVDYGFAYGEMPEPSRIGYSFDGWRLDGVAVASNTVVSALDDHLLVAQWEKNWYTVAFDANGGECGTESVSVEYGGTLGASALPDGELPVPTRSEAVFLGWFTAADGGDVVDASLTVTNAMTLYAHWLTEVESPVISTGGVTEFRTNTCEVTITCATAGVTIYYSDDGSTPRKDDAYLYTGSITITETTTFKAIAVIGSIQSEYATVTITKRPLTLEEALDAGEGVEVATSESVPWRAVILNGQDARSLSDVFAARSGEIGNRTNTWLSASVSGAGMMTFWCKTSCEHDEDGTFTWDRLMVYTNGVEIADWRMDGETDWTQRTLAFASGENTIKWVYFKDRTGAEGEDCAWVDAVTWTPTGGNTDTVVDAGGGKSVTVPGAWIAEHSALVEAAGGDTSAALAATAANGRKVWECYALGLDPEDSSATNDFKITSFPLKADGTPDIEHIVFDPPQARWNVPATYKVKGAVNLSDTEWPEVTEGNKGLFRFFKVELVLP